MILFTKQNCSQCEYVKSNVDTKLLNIDIQQLDDDNYESLSLLAWHSLVRVAEKTLPILVTDKNSYIKNPVAIINYLQDLAKEKEQK